MIEWVLLQFSIAISQGTKQTHTNKGYGLEGKDTMYNNAESPEANNCSIINLFNCYLFKTISENNFINNWQWVSKLYPWKISNSFEYVFK